MKRSFALLSLVAFVVVAQESFASLIVDDAPAAIDVNVYDEPQIIAHYDIGLPETGNGFRVDWDAFDNTVNFTGHTAMNGGTALLNGLLTTRFVSDDLYVGQSNVGYSVTGFDWCVANLNPSVTNARMIVSFHQDNLTNAPFARIASYFFGTRAIPAGVTCYHTNTSNFSIPSPTIWMGITFDNSNATVTVGELNKLGLGVFDPPLSGSSLDEDFISPGPSQGAQDFPVGTVRSSPYGGNPVANYGFRVSPEPGSLCLLAVAAFALVRRNHARRSSADR